MRAKRIDHVDVRRILDDGVEVIVVTVCDPDPEEWSMTSGSA
jgi:hypothetical protein